MRIQPLSLLTPRVEKVPSLRELTIRAKDDFRQFMANDWFQTLDTGFAIYQIQAGNQTHTGVLALNDIRDFDLGKIKKHENTLTKREAEYHILLKDWRAVIKPVLLTFPANATLSQWMNAYIAQHAPSFVVPMAEDAEQHRYWLVSQDADIQFVKNVFEQIEAVYIADGHHRTTTIANFAKLSDEARGHLDFSHLFAAFFPDDQLRIMGYHRLVTFGDSTEAETQLAQIQEIYGLTPLNTPRLPAQRREIVVVKNGECYSLDWSTLTMDKDLEMRTLDTALLNDIVFRQLFHIEDTRSDKRVTYIDGASSLQGMLKATIEHKNALGFLMYPVSFEELYLLSDREERLPPKSTWFEPRIKSGLTVYSLD